MYQKEEERPGTWTSAVIKAIQKAGIELEPEVAIKSSWKKEVKKRLDVFNEMEVRAEKRSYAKRENGIERRIWKDRISEDEL